MAFDYAWGIQKFINLCDKKFEHYLQERNLSTKEKELSTQRYLEERELILEQVSEHPKMVKGLWVCTLMEEVQRRTDVIVRNHLVQCPFIMYLFQMASYNVLEKGYISEPYLYKKSKVSVYDYAVTLDFYPYASHWMEEIFAKCGYTLLWMQEPGSVFEKHGLPSGFAVTKREFSYHRYAKHLTTLYDGKVCLKDDFDWQTEGVVDEVYWFEVFREENVDKNVITREDLLREVTRFTDDIEQAYQWVEEMRRGKLYVPSRWRVLETYYRKSKKMCDW